MFNAIWCEGKHFRTQRIDDKRNTQDCGVIASFEGANGAMDDYCGIIQDIIKLDFRCFFVYVLDVKWFKDVVERGPNATIKRHASGFVTIDSTKFWQSRKDTLVLPQQCEQVLCTHIKILAFKYLMQGK